MSEEDENINRVGEIIRYSNEQFDKNILFIASGALGISFAFIKEIIPDLNNANDKNYLFASWYIFASVIFISLVAHFIAILAGNWAFKNNHLEYDVYNRKILRWNIPIRCMNILTIICIFIGALFLIYFINNNL